MTMNTSSSMPQRTPAHRGSGMRQVYDWQDFKADAKRARKKIKKYGKRAVKALGTATSLNPYARAAGKKKKSAHGGKVKKGAGMPLNGY